MKEDVGRSKPKKHANKIRWDPKLNKPLPYNLHKYLNHYKAKYCTYQWRWKKNVKKGAEVGALSALRNVLELIIFMSSVATDIQVWLIEMWRMNEKCIKSYFAPATGQCSSTSSSSGVTSNVVIVETDETDNSPHTSESEEESSDMTCNVSGQTDCSCYCCSTSSDSSSVPFQPLQKQFSLKRQGKHTRAFQHKWFQEHSWLAYCVTRDKAFCHVCRVAVNKALVRMTKKRGHQYLVAFVFNHPSYIRNSRKKFFNTA